MRGKNLIIIATLLATINSCRVDNSKIINLDLLKSDWFNANYNYILFFNDSSVTTAPNDNFSFVFKYKLKNDTLFIENYDYKYSQYWEKYRILTLNKDILVLENLTKNNIRLNHDTITLINTSSINKNDFLIERLSYSIKGRYEKKYEVYGDSIIFIGSIPLKSSGTFYANLTPEIKDQLNRKIKLLELSYPDEIDDGGPHTPSFSLSIKLMGYKGFELSGGVPNPDDNILLAGFIVYLNNLDRILDFKEINK